MIDEALQQLMESVASRKPYDQISPDLVRWVGQRELEKRRNFKQAVKATRSKLHQVAGAYLEENIDYDKWQAMLDDLPKSLHNPELQAACLHWMEKHASSHERLPIINKFFQQTLQNIAPINSILDVGCGLNPLALPWMPLNAGCQYYGLDIFTDMVRFLNQFLHHAGVQGQIEVHSLTEGLKKMQAVQLALLLKTIPCMEQLDKSLGEYLLDNVRAEYMLVSFPIQSLGGHQKGMRRYYEEHFLSIIKDRHFVYERHEFATELAFLLKSGK
jgi:16S rRNA (guanine(1405)-N(7))-methyltransferase